MMALRYVDLNPVRAGLAKSAMLALLLAPQPGGGGDAVQAMAWLELARDAKVAEAESLLAAVRSTLSDEDIARAEKLKKQLLRN